MKDAINILVTLDENYLPPLKVMLYSLSKNNPKKQFTIWLIHDAISEEKIADLCQFTEALKFELHSLKIENYVFPDAPTLKKYPKEMYFRLLCGEILPEEVQRVIYLDPDTLIINPIDELWTLDLEGKMIGAASHSGLMNFSDKINNLRLGIDHSYYNSGVMLMDVQQLRTKVKAEDIYEVIEKHGNLLILPDQDILNYLYGDLIKEIPEEKWNCDSRDGLTHFAKSMGEINTQWLMQNTVILHFCGSPKPWDSKSNNRFAVLYQHYQQLMKNEMNLLPDEELISVVEE